jgi:hypothetical protein
MYFTYCFIGYIIPIKIDLKIYSYSEVIQQLKMDKCLGKDRN